MGFSLNPKKAFEQLTRAPGQALDAAESATGVAKDAFEVAKDAPGVAKEVVEDSFKAAKYLADHPPDLGQIRRTTLALGEGRQIAKRYIVSDAAGTVVIGNEQYFTDGKVYQVSLGRQP